MKPNFKTSTVALTNNEQQNKKVFMWRNTDDNNFDFTDILKKSTFLVEMKKFFLKKEAVNVQGLLSKSINDHDNTLYKLLAEELIIPRWKLFIEELKENLNTLILDKVFTEETDGFLKICRDHDSIKSLIIDFNDQCYAIFNRTVERVSGFAFVDDFESDCQKTFETSFIASKIKNFENKNIRITESFCKDVTENNDWMDYLLESLQLRMEGILNSFIEQCSSEEKKLNENIKCYLKLENQNKNKEKNKNKK